MLARAEHIHIYDSGGVVSKFLPVVNFFNYLGATITIGTFLAIIFFLSNQKGQLNKKAISLREVLKISLLVWLIVQFGFVILQVAVLFQISIASALAPSNFATFLFQSGLGESEFIALASTLLSFSLIYRSEEHTSELQSH